MDIVADCLLIKYWYKMTEKDMKYKNTQKKHADF